MQDNSYRNDRDEIRDLLKQFENLRSGMSHGFLEEESFEKIIDYYDEKDEISKALEAAEFGVGQFPYSSSLLIKKADLLIATRKYEEALDILEKAEILDSSDIDIYILKTDALLALDQHERAVGILEEAITLFEGDNRINLLFELADVYDDYEEFDKVFDCLTHILEYDPINEEALYKYVSGPILPEGEKKASRYTGGLLMNIPTMNWHGSTWGQPTRGLNCLKSQLMPTNTPWQSMKNSIMPTVILLMPISGCENTAMRSSRWRR